MIKMMIKWVAVFYAALMSTSVSANVTIIVNQQVFEFEQPVRLNAVLAPVANSAQWYWPVSSVYNLNLKYAEQEKASVLSEIRRLLGVYKKDNDMHRTLSSLYEQVASWTVATRIPMSVSYNRARLFPQDNPQFNNGKYLIRISPRPDLVHVSGAVLKPGAYKHSGNTSIYTIANSVAVQEEADKSYVNVITPMGNVEKKGVAYWNVNFSQIMPGSQIYVPISPRYFDSAIEPLNDRIANLAVHRILPQ